MVTGSTWKLQTTTSTGLLRRWSVFFFSFLEISKIGKHLHFRSELSGGWTRTPNGCRRPGSSEQLTKVAKLEQNVRSNFWGSSGQTQSIFGRIWVRLVEFVTIWAYSVQRMDCEEKVVSFSGMLLQLTVLRIQRKNLDNHQYSVFTTNFFVIH